MASFDFKAIDADGKDVKSSIDARDENGALDKLQAQGMQSVQFLPPKRIPKNSDAVEEHIAGAVECPTCGSVYKLDERLLNCKNCGNELPQPSLEKTDREFLGVFSSLKSIADSQSERMRRSGMMEDVGRPSMKVQVESSVTCGWCGQHYDKRPDSPNCESCGGVLPLPPSSDPGPEPPPAPRRLPAKFKFNLYVRQNLGGVVGIGMVFVGLLALCPAFPFGAILIGLGGFIGGFNTISAYRRSVAIQRGKPVLGKIERVEKIDGATEEQKKNSVPLYQVHFRFDVDGRPVKGMKYTYDPDVMQHFVGEPVWVLYMPNNPAYYALWPPLA